MPAGWARFFAFAQQNGAAHRHSTGPAPERDGRKYGRKLREAQGIMAGLRIGIAGCAGRMGAMLVRQVVAMEGCDLAAGSVEPDSPEAGKDVGVLAGLPALGCQATPSDAALFAASEAVIDFTAPTATTRHAALAAEHGCILVSGTTGMDGTQMAALEQAATTTPIIWAANMSLGVNLLQALVERVASILDPAYDIEVLEMHHRHKVDAPSGTALALGRAAAAGRGVELDEVSDRVRDGHTGARPSGHIGFATLRGGDVVGDHSVIFAAEGERLELSHKAGSRAIFARGAVRAALWAQGRDPGLYSMRDVLGLQGRS